MTSRHGPPAFLGDYREHDAQQCDDTDEPVGDDGQQRRSGPRFATGFLHPGEQALVAPFLLIDGAVFLRNPKPFVCPVMQDALRNDGCTRQLPFDTD